MARALEAGAASLTPAFRLHLNPLNIGADKQGGTEMLWEGVRVGGEVGGKDGSGQRHAHWRQGLLL